MMLLGILVVQQRKIIYVPAPPGTPRRTSENPGAYKSPSAWGLPYENLMVPTSDGTKVNAWLVYQPMSNCQQDVPFTFVYFHGNAGNIGHRLENIRDMHAKLKINILIVDYRGYGESEDGDGPSERGFMLDAMGAYRWLIERIRNPKQPEVTKMREDRILLFGRSIGGAVAIRLMADVLRESLAPGARDALPVPTGLVLENTFTALRDMAVQLFPFLSFLSPLLRPPMVFDPWDSTDSLAFLTQNHKAWCCCLLSGLEDQMVPPAQMRQLREIMKKREPQVLKYFTFKHGGHNDTPTRGGPEYWLSFQKFMALVIASEADRRQLLAGEEPDGAAKE